MRHRIYTDLVFKSKRGVIKMRALVDTGATDSVIPDNIARLIIIHKTPFTTSLRGFMKNFRTPPAPIIIAETYFPTIRKKGRFMYAMVHGADEIIIGMNILSLAGIHIDTRTGGLSVKNEIWEAFKTLSGIAGLGAIGYLLYKEAKKKK